MGPIASFKLNLRGRGSLRRKLTLQVAVLAALGLGGITAWAAMQMRQILIGSHQQTLGVVAERFESDVEKYLAKQQYSPQQSLERAVAQIPQEDVLLWVYDPEQKGVLVRSDAAIADPMTLQILEPQVLFPSRNDLVRIEPGELYLEPPASAETILKQSEPRYLLVRGLYLDAFPSSTPQERLKLYLAYDLTPEHHQYVKTVQRLSMASALLLILLTTAIAYSVRQATEPLNQISQQARQISAAELGTARLELEQAPAEIDGLVQTFNAMLVRLSDAWNKQRQFVNDASHELRTPLAIVHGYLQSVLRRQESLNPVQREALITASEETQRTIHMLQELLAIARADNGQLEFNVQPTMAQPLLREVTQLSQDIHQRSIALDLPSKPIKILADVKHLTQVLLNLLDNAVKYSEPSEPIQLSLSMRAEQAQIEVRDRGIGIAAEHLDCVFERFYRADEARNRKGGTGLGLALVKTLVEGMGGQITVRSKLKEGSTFSIVLPCPPG